MSSQKDTPPPAKTDNGRTGRLPGFKLPRDLSLGAVTGTPRGASTAGKKVFTPNLNVSRNKAAPVPDASKSNGKPQRGRADRGRGRGGRGRGTDRINIQSMGLFSEGIAAAPHKKLQARPTYTEAEDSHPVRPTLKRQVQKVDEEEEKQKLKDFLGEEDDAEIPRFVRSEDFATPIVLSQLKTALPTPECQYPESLASFFQRTTPQIFLCQLPDTLPGQGNDRAEVKKINVPEGGDDDDDDEKDDRTNFCLLKGLQEGLVGKFVRHKSGKTKLVLGNTRFDVDLGLEPGFLQEVITVRTNTTQRSGDMTNLGKISAKINVSPDWEDMFQTLTTSTS